MSVRKYVNGIFFVYLFAFACGLVVGQTADKPNIIFIVIDDLNDFTETLGGHPQVLGPGLHRLESYGITFTNAHASAPKCAPSRTSFITGKEVVYTQVYNNPACKPFRDYFTPGKGNDYVFTMPEYFKDSAGYFTYNINKVYHCFDTDYDYDFSTEDPCQKLLSWSKYSLFEHGDDTSILNYGSENGQGVSKMQWCPIPDSMEKISFDYRAVDSATAFLHLVQENPEMICNKPFMMFVGLRKPHTAWYIPEHYWLPFYGGDIHDEDFQLSYNHPQNAYPYNGVFESPQPEVEFGDFFAFPEGSLSRYVAAFDSVYYNIQNEVEDTDPLPFYSDTLTYEERFAMTERSMRANSLIAYLAASRFVDHQIDRLLDSLAAFPEIMNNTIIVLASDHGFSLGEKRHWLKGTMWETDLRIPFIIADMRDPESAVCNSPVSLIDLFPTLCDLTGIAYPPGEDGGAYLDGNSFMPLLEDPQRKIEKVMLGTYTEQGAGISQCSCFPQYSLRTDRFHYILYRSNNAEGLSGCDAASSYPEDELYEIGVDRKTDPNEWNDLSGDSAYFPLIRYMQQWLPDSALYKQTTYKAEISNSEIPCLLSAGDVLDLHVQFRGTTGDVIATPDSLEIYWINNITSDTLFGTDVTFPLSLLPDTFFTPGNFLMMYCIALDTQTHIMRALDLKYFYPETGAPPSVDFNVVNAGVLTFAITDFSISGDYQYYWWEINGDSVFFDQVPGLFSFEEPDAFTITCYVVYGNNASCITSHTYNFATTFNEWVETNRLAILPNPAQEVCGIYFDTLTQSSTVMVSATDGHVVETMHIPDNTSFFTFSTDLYPAGLYIISVGTPEGVISGKLVVSH